MTALTPDLAAAYVRALSCDVRSVSAGPVGAQTPPEGDVIRGRSGDVEVVIVLGPHALPALAGYDAERAAEALSVGDLAR